MPKLYEEKSRTLTMPELSGEGWLKKAMDFLERAVMTPEERLHFEMDIVRTVAVENKIEEEKQAAVEIERKKGEVALEENNRRIGKVLKNQGVGFDKISLATGLTIDEIEQL